LLSLLFHFKQSSPTLIYTLSLHDALPIFERRVSRVERRLRQKLFLTVEVTCVDRIERIGQGDERRQPQRIRQPRIVQVISNQRRKQKEAERQRAADQQLQLQGFRFDRIGATFILRNVLRDGLRRAGDHHRVDDRNDADDDLIKAELLLAHQPRQAEMDAETAENEPELGGADVKRAAPGDAGYVSRRRARRRRWCWYGLHSCSVIP